MPDIEGIERVHEESGEVYLRNAVVLAYFIDKPVHEIGDQISVTLDAYLELIPKDSLRWVIANSNSEEWKPFGNRTITNCKKQLEPAGAKARDITSFRLSSHGGEAPNYEFYFVGKPGGADHQNSTSLLQLVFPIDVAKANRVDQFVATIVELTKKLSFQSGYCSPALLFSDLHLIDRYEEIRDLAMEHPGYDMNENMMAAWTMAGKIRGARWITLLGPELLIALGGINALKKQLKEPFSVEGIDSSIMIRAGKTPELGDVNQNIDTPLLRKVAELLRPISFFGDTNLVIGQFEDDDTLLTQC